MTEDDIKTFADGLRRIAEIGRQYMNEKPQTCYGCGKPADKKSKHWPDAWVCENCNDFQIATDYAWHCMTGQ